MSKQLINVGTIINDGTGDTFRAGAIKVNGNFDELYTALTKDNTLSVVNYITAGAGIVVDNNSGTITIANTLANTKSFGVVKIGATNVTSAIQQDTLNLTAGSGINISGNASTKTVTVALSGNITSTLNGLTYPSTSGLSGQVLTSNGANSVAWTTQIPTQTSNSGRLLTTNGTATSWTTDLSVNGSRVTTTANATLNLTGKAGYITNLVGSSDVQLQWIASASLPTVTGLEGASTNYVYVNSTGTNIENIDAQGQTFRWRFQTNGIFSVPGVILGTSLQSNGALLVASNSQLTIGTGDKTAGTAADIVIAGGAGGTASLDGEGDGGSIVLQGGAAGPDGLPGVVRAASPMSFKHFSEEERDLLIVAPSTIIWNTTNDKLQVFTGEGWANLH